jgi:hypothetical protein
MTEALARGRLLEAAGNRNHSVPEHIIIVRVSADLDLSGFHHVACLI